MNTAKFFKYVWPFFNIRHERVQINNLNITNPGKIADIFNINFAALAEPPINILSEYMENKSFKSFFYP